MYKEASIAGARDWELVHNLARVAVDELEHGVRRIDDVHVAHAKRLGRHDLLVAGKGNVSTSLRSALTYRSALQAGVGFIHPMLPTSMSPGEPVQMCSVVFMLR